MNDKEIEKWLNDNGIKESDFKDFSKIKYSLQDIEEILFDVESYIKRKLNINDNKKEGGQRIKPLEINMDSVKEIAEEMEREIYVKKFFDN